MKLFFASVAAMAATTVAAPAAAQLPPELLGQGGSSSAGSLFSEAFYKGPEGFWVLMRNQENDGMRCSVNWITAGGQTLAFHGPWDAQMASANMGMFWFTGGQIPRAPRTPGRVQITVASKDPTATYPAMHMNAGDSPAFVMVGDVRQQMRTDKKNDDDIAVTYQGKQVYHIQVIRLQEAYRKLERCMDAGRAAAAPAPKSKKKR